MRVVRMVAGRSSDFQNTHKEYTLDQSYSQRFFVWQGIEDIPFLL